MLHRICWLGNSRGGKLRISPLIIHLFSQLCFIQHPPLVLSLTHYLSLVPISSLSSHYSLSVGSELEGSREDGAVQRSRVTLLTLSSLNQESNFTGTLNK